MFPMEHVVDEKKIARSTMARVVREKNSTDPPWSTSFRRKVKHFTMERVVDEKDMYDPRWNGSLMRRICTIHHGASLRRWIKPNHCGARQWGEGWKRSTKERVVEEEKKNDPPWSASLKRCVEKENGGLQVVGFDMVDDESKPERRPLKHMQSPAQWDLRHNPAYNYYCFYLYANLYILNKLREARGLNTFTFRPHAGGSAGLFQKSDNLPLCSKFLTYSKDDLKKR
jgi:hypothetical protein